MVPGDVTSHIGCTGHICQWIATRSRLKNFSLVGGTLHQKEEKYLDYLLQHPCGWSATSTSYHKNSCFKNIQHQFFKGKELFSILDEWHGLMRLSSLEESSLVPRCFSFLQIRCIFTTRRRCGELENPYRRFTMGLNSLDISKEREEAGNNTWYRSGILMVAIFPWLEACEKGKGGLVGVNRSDVGIHTQASHRFGVWWGWASRSGYQLGCYSPMFSLHVLPFLGLN